MVFESIFVTIPLIIAFVGIGFAIVERGYKSFLEKKEIDPKLQFNPAYLLNIIITTGAMVAIVTGVLPAVISEISASPDIPLTLGAVVLNFVLGYSLTYRILDALNNSTEKRLEVEALKEDTE
jgi:hypothetical protein